MLELSDRHPLVRAAAGSLLTIAAVAPVMGLIDSVYPRYRAYWLAVSLVIWTVLFVLFSSVFRL